MKILHAIQSADPAGDGPVKGSWQFPATLKSGPEAAQMGVSRQAITSA
jgi:hypothetical protein